MTAIGNAVFIILANVVLARAQSVTLTSTLINGISACPYSEVIFTCETRGFNAMHWASEEYIGPDNLTITFGKLDLPGYQKNVSNLTFATLSKKVNYFLRSQLRIMPNLSSTPSIVSCEATSGQAANISRNVTFKVLPEPNEPTDVTAIQIKDSNGKCFIHCSWMKPNNSDEVNVTQYNVYINGTLYPDLSPIERANRIVVYISDPSFDCFMHTIDVRAINDCGEGMKSPDASTIPNHFVPDKGKSGPPSKVEWLKML